MTTTYDQMLLAALRFRATALWKRFDDSMIFALVLPSGEKGYCCVMGNAGQHYALALFRGNVGFSTFLDQLYAGSLNQFEQFEAYTTFECINCDYVNANDPELLPDEKKRVKSAAENNGIKMARPNGWPCLKKFDNGHVTLGLHAQSDIDDMAAALNAAIEVAAKTAQMSDDDLSALGLSPLGDYPDDEGGKIIPLLTPLPDGSFEWASIATPAYMPKQYTKITVNDDAFAHIKKMRHIGVYQIRIMHMTATVGSKADFYHPSIMILARTSDGTIVPVMAHTDNPAEETESLVDGLIDQMKNGMVPFRFEVCDDRTENAIADLCRKTGIKLNRVDRLNEVEEARAFLAMQGF